MFNFFVMNYIRVFLLFVLVTLGACSDDDRIVLPVVEEYNLSLGSSLESGEFRVIQSEEDLLAVVSESVAREHGLLDIDFSANTLLLGKETCKYMPAGCNYVFFREEGIYRLEVQVHLTIAPAVTTFEYGVLVGKLPENAQVICSVEEN